MAKFLEGDVRITVSDDVKKILARLLIEDMSTIARQKFAIGLGVVMAVDFVGTAAKMLVLFGMTMDDVWEEVKQHPEYQGGLGDMLEQEGKTEDELKDMYGKSIDTLLGWAKDSLKRHPDVWRLKSDYQPEVKDGVAVDAGVKVPKRGDLNAPGAMPPPILPEDPK